MTNATLVETVTLSGSENKIEQDDNTITVGTDIYKVTTVYVEQRSDTNSKPNRYHYDQFNTISSKRQYEIEKIWNLHETLSKTYEGNIQAVVASLQRCKLKDLNTANIVWKPVYNYVLLYPDSNGKWKTTLTDLDKYDEDGNAYYYSANEVGFLVYDTTDSNKLPANAQVGQITVDGGTGQGQHNNYVAFSYYGQNTPKWGCSYSRTEDKTTVSNHDSPGSGYFSISKSWKDNNDKDRPESVIIRIYDREDLYRAVRDKTGDMNLDDLDSTIVQPIRPVTSIEDGGVEQSYDIVLSKSNGYTVNQTFRSLCNNNETTAKRKTIANYVVLEYKVGDGRQSPVSYTYEQIAALSAPDIESASALGTADYQGTVETKNRSYKVTNTRNTSRNTYYILNERSGITTLTLTKTWNDENNRDNLRPNEVSFQLFRDAMPCTDLSGVDFTINQENVVITPEMEGDSYTGNFTATYTGQGGNTASQWIVTVSNLPMFSNDSGMLYAYNIDEQNNLKVGGTSSNNDDVHYVQSRGMVETTQTGSTQTFSIPLTNTVVGITSHTAYKYWKDVSVTEKGLRPELILTLYRYVGSKAESITTLPAAPTYDDLIKLNDDQQEDIGFEKVPNYNDPILTPGDGIETGASGQPYDWKIDINDLQRFNSEGKEYVYVLREQMSNDGETVLGTYKGKTTRKSVGEGSNKKEYDEFTNTITANLTLSGVKTWRGHELYTLTMTDLPKPTIRLYRTTAAIFSNQPDLNGLTEEQIDSYVSNDELVMVDEIQMTDSNKTSYAFPSTAKIQWAGVHEEAPPYMVLERDRLMLPKYDENGQRYNYLTREKLDDDIVEALYAKTSVTGTLVNTLNSDINWRNITVHKSWANRPDDQHLEKYHSVTFNLYRYVQENGIDSARLYDRKTFTAEQLKNAQGEINYTFSHVLVKSPTGQNYGYYVTEEAIDGYSTIVSKNSNFEDSVPLSEAKTLVFTDTEDWNNTAGIHDDIYFKNTYEPSRYGMRLKGSKIWNDWRDEAGIRPESINVRLTRITHEEKNQSNNIDPHEVTVKPKVEWDALEDKRDYAWIEWKTNGTDSWGRTKWTYELGGLPRYAPNGMPYIYTIVEDRPEGDGYQDSGKVDTSDKTPYEEDDSLKMDFDALTNSLTESYRFRKYWQDGSNLYNLRPESITVVLQYSTDGGVNWQDMEFKEKFELKDSDNNNERVGVSQRWFAYDGTNHQGALAVELTAAKDATANSGNNTWDYEFKNLPAKRMVEGQESAQNVIYRCIEVKIGKAELSEANVNLSTMTNDALKAYDQFKAGAYKVVYRTVGNNSTEVKNTLDSSSLKVKKLWENDQDDMYESRPEYVKFKLQRKGQNVGNDGSSLIDWTDVEVPGENGAMEPYTFTVTKAGGWERTLDDLPVTGTDENGVDFYSMEYRAVEVHDPDIGVTVKYAKNYEDQMDYGEEEVDSDNDGYTDGHTFNIDSANEKNASTIYNKLRTLDTSITAQKVWYASDVNPDANVKAIFELQYRVKDTTNTTEWNSYSNNLTQTLTKDANGVSRSVSWTGLPQYNLAGEELEYQIIEHQVEENEQPVDKYKTIVTSSTEGNNICFNFTNIELQSYTVKKEWRKPGIDTNNNAYIPDADGHGNFTATFDLQQKIGNGAWTNCTPPVESESGTQTLTGDSSYTWHDLPKYTAEGDQITYRAVEKKINGNDVATINGNDTDGNYIVTYDYDNNVTTPDNKPNPGFDDIRTDSVNRLVYGFVDLSKEAAYLAPGVTPVDTESGGKKLSGIEFKIQEKKENDNGTITYTDYAKGIITDSNGHLTRNSDGTYGTEHRYLIPGVYRLLEVNTHNNDYSPWDGGVEFTVGLKGGTTDTGEHGTAWISTNTTGSTLTLNVSYLRPSPEPASHSFGDNCVPNDNSSDAYNLESRGVIKFTKTGPQTGSNVDALDIHSGSTGEDAAYFGVYIDEACTSANQVAGMTAEDGVHFVLTDRAQDGINLAAVKHTTTGDIPYLRPYNTGFTLLSGTYYVKELVAPAGYKVDTTPREVTIARLNPTTMGSDLSQVYGNNLGTFADGNTTAYQWTNNPNKVTIYKMDQFGRPVTLKDISDGEPGYLELKFDESNSVFPTGENTIHLYQNAAKPATKTDGTQVGNESGKWSISYDTAQNTWIITGLFDAGKSYTLSEPQGAVPDDNVVAKPITFTIGADGQMIVDPSDTHINENTDPTQASGRHDKDVNDYNNYYQPSTNNNKVVLRDVARFRKNVALKKVESGTETSIQYISFELWHGIPGDQIADEMVTDTILRTDENGEINLSKLADSVINKLTNAPLKNGLDRGDYFFQELEKGASDGYRLVGDIAFSIKPDTPADPTNADYEDYAKVEFVTSNMVAQTGDQGIVSNTPTQSKSLNLTKKDYNDDNLYLSGARFKLEYVSITNGDEGSKTNASTPVITSYAMTDARGELKTATVDGNGNWSIGANAPDISAKGTYTLTELQAPTKDSTNSHGYSTYTNSGTTATPEMLQFKVNSNNEIEPVSGNNDSYVLSSFTGTSLVEDLSAGTGNDGDFTVTVKNHKTLLKIDKLNDIVNDVTKIKTEDQHDLTGETLAGAELEIYEGVGHENTQNRIWTNFDNTSESNWTLSGVLSENTIYTLHEKEAPVGFLKADDIYFCLFGTRVSGNNVESQLYVWTGSTPPTGSTVTPENLSASNSLWSKTQNLNADNDLTMVDEAIIAPVDARKILKTGDTTYSALPGATFKVSVSGAGGAELGIVVSDTNGYLKWQSLTSSALNGLVYNSSGKRITAAGDAVGQTVILRQNAEGYTFTETYAPDNAYNRGIGEDKVYRVAITDQNYRDYKDYPNRVIDLVAAENDSNHTVLQLTERRTMLSDSDLINPAYHSTVTLHKYDSDPEANSASIPGTKFTLYRHGENNAREVYTEASGTNGVNGIFTTDANGDLSITIPEKGTYTLEETEAAPGYKLDSNNKFTFTLVDKASDGKFDHDRTTVLERDSSGAPNDRQYGSITLNKTDVNSGVTIDGVVYTINRTDLIGQYFSNATQTVTTGRSYIATYEGVGTGRRCTLTEEPSEAWQRGKIIISGLDWGTYTLTETTEVSGYKLDMDDATQQTAHTKTFTINNSCINPGPQGDTNLKNSVTFHKTDNGSSPKNLSGAVFEVRDASNHPVEFYLSAGATTKVTQAKSGSEGTVTVYGLPTDPTGVNNPTTYKLVEVTAPAGYVVNPNPVEFTIDRKGNVKMSGGNSNVTEVPMTDKPILVTLQKKGETGNNLLDGAVFTLKPDSGSRFVNNETSKTLTLENGTLDIPIETLVGGNSYTLTETKAPDGYEATAEIHFTVETDGRVTIVSTSGGYGTTCCEAENVSQVTGALYTDTGTPDEYRSTLSIRDEKIRVTLTKVDSRDSSIKLGGVTYTLKPYGTGDRFAVDTGFSGLSQGVFTATTGTEGSDLGVIYIPDGLLVHGCKYLLQETSIPNSMRYYLGKEAKDGVILNVDTDGSISVERLEAYEGKTVNEDESCPVSADHVNGHVQLTAKNPKATIFEFDKDVAGNMGDLTGNFNITMEVYEPDGTFITSKTVTLQKGERYSSENGKKVGNVIVDGDCAFGPNAIPVDALLKIKEEPAQDYEAVAVNLQNAEIVTENERGEVWIKLTEDYTNPATFTLTNNKEVAIDVGVMLEHNAPYALVAILIPAVWLFIRVRRKKKGGDVR